MMEISLFMVTATIIKLLSHPDTLNQIKHNLQTISYKKDVEKSIINSLL